MLRPALVLFRQDLRLADNPALEAAARSGRPVIPIYVRDDLTPQPWQTGGAQKWWLHHSLAALKQSLGDWGLTLILRCGNWQEVVNTLICQTKAEAVYWNLAYEPCFLEHDAEFQAWLGDMGVEVHTFNANLMLEPHALSPKTSDYYKVFTPFWKTCMKELPPRPPIAKRKPEPYAKKLDSDKLENWQLLPKDPNWADEFPNYWTPGEEGAQKALKSFLAGPVKDYGTQRDFPDIVGTSRLSPHLHFGEISPYQVWHRVASSGIGPAQQEPYLRQLGWREFAHHLLYHFPELPEQPFNERFKGFTWKRSQKKLEAWQNGLTGYPIVDAGMRELWRTGWMHNRVRMIVGSFLTKDLMIHWKEGEKWFWDCLVDADLANNSFGWQWIAGCGADAAPYFRIFNPILQGKKFDPDGDYVKQWVPELEEVDKEWIHCPWEAPELVLRASGVTLGKDYPYPIVDHAEARDQALEQYEKTKR